MEAGEGLKLTMLRDPASVECELFNLKNPIHPLTGGTNVQTTDICFVPMRQDDEEGNGEGLTLTERRLLSPEHFRSS